MRYKRQVSLKSSTRILKASCSLLAQQQFTHSITHVRHVVRQPPHKIYLLLCSPNGNTHSSPASIESDLKEGLVFSRQSVAVRALQHICVCQAPQREQEIHLQNIMAQIQNKKSLCYLCHYPVVGGGVPIRKLDQKKLSKWWLENLQTEFEYVRMKTKSICKFCIWDAK